MFSERAAFDLRKNRLTLLLEEMRRADAEIIDLTASNPTAVGLHYPEETILKALSLPDSLLYEPSAKGLEKTRIAVSDYYQERGRTVSADDTILTSSTSEAYSLVFKLLVDPRDQILFPSPSYPLFDFLARLECAQTESYPLCYEDGWRFDLDRLESIISPRTKAIVLVNPNNPTGSYISRDEWKRLKELCLTHRIAVICDEVFMDYPIDDQSPPFEPWSEADPLTFLLNGLSKSSGLPQMKLGWIAVCGPAKQKKQSLDRLEVISDTFLSVGTPIQHAAPVLLEASRQVRKQIQNRTRSNYGFLRKACIGTCVQCLKTEGGWSAILRLPRVKSEEQWVLHYLESSSVLVHPGYFFDLPQEAYIVLSLLPLQSKFQEGVERLLSKT